MDIGMPQHPLEGGIIMAQKMTLNAWHEALRDHKIAVIGAGISNRPLLRWLAPQSDRITVFDRMDPNDPRMRAIRHAFDDEGLRFQWSLGPDYLRRLHGFDVIFRTPKMDLQLAELIAERERGAVITSEIAVVCDASPAPVTAVTGSDGKTTTTTLIGKMLEAAGHTVHVGGNIGTPLIDRIDRIRPTDRVVLELSSFQLMDMLPVIDRAVITNIVPNHLDFHRTFEEYVNAKKNIFRAQSPAGILVLNAQDAVSAPFNREAKGEVRYLNAPRTGRMCTARRENDALWLDDPIRDTRTKIINVDEVRLPGDFNLENIMAATLATYGDVYWDAVRRVARTFAGVPHRMEWVRNVDGVDFYNSSVDSSPQRTIKTLGAFRDAGRSIVLIAGGQDKKSDYTGLGQAIAETTDRVILTGQNIDLIRRSIEAECASAGRRPDQMTVLEADDLDRAVTMALELAHPGDGVVMSPAGTSYDRFHHFEERGERFRALVRRL
jgi:UDP-N-acetylmuramoylalanine--D-glutamate ligase